MDHYLNRGSAHCASTPQQYLNGVAHNNRTPQKNVQKRHHIKKSMHGTSGHAQHTRNTVFSVLPCYIVTLTCHSGLLLYIDTRNRRRNSTVNFIPCWHCIL